MYTTDILSKKSHLYFEIDFSEIRSTQISTNQIMMYVVDYKFNFKDERVDWIFKSLMKKGNRLNFEIENGETCENVLNFYLGFKFNNQSEFTLDSGAFHSLQLHQTFIEKIYLKLPVMKTMNLKVDIDEIKIEKLILKILKENKDTTFKLEIENWTLIF